MYIASKENHSLGVLQNLCKPDRFRIAVFDLTSNCALSFSLFFLITEEKKRKEKQLTVRTH